MKVQASKKAIIRYPLHGTDGVLDVERKWLRSSTTDQGNVHPFSGGSTQR